MLVALLLMTQVGLSNLAVDRTEGCTDKDSVIALSSCYSQHAEVWEQRLAIAYPAALAAVKGPQRAALERSQKAWVKYRAASCDFYSLTPGSIHSIQGAYCMLDLTRRRALELEEYVLP